jgi:hypothetical protein
MVCIPVVSSTHLFKIIIRQPHHLFIKNLVSDRPILYLIVNQLPNNFNVFQYTWLAPIMPE